MKPSIEVALIAFDQRIPDADMHWDRVLAALGAARRNPAQAREQPLATDRVRTPTLTLRPDHAVG